MAILEIKFQIRYSTKLIRRKFDSFYEILYEGLKTQISGPYHYQSLNLLRRLIFAYIVFYFPSEEFTLFQIMLNLILSFMFATYLAAHRPFVDPDLNRMQLLNEITYYVVSCLYICFTDFNPNPVIKVNCGWIVILIAILNLICPNFTYLLSGIWPDIIGALTCKKPVKPKKKKISLVKLEKFRQKFIKDKKLKLKDPPT